MGKSFVSFSMPDPRRFGAGGAAVASTEGRTPRPPDQGFRCATEPASGREALRRGSAPPLPHLGTPENLMHVSLDMHAPTDYRE